MMKYRVIISAPYMQRLSEKEKVKKYIEDIDHIEFSWVEVDERLGEEQLLKLLPAYDGIICGDDRFTEKVYQASKNLKVIVKWGTGTDSICVDMADKYGVKVFRTKNAFTEPVADTTLGYILSFARNIAENDRILKNGGWDKPQGFSLFEKTVGIIGFGDIGQAVAKRLIPFGTKILVNDVKDKGEFSAVEIIDRVSFVEKEEIWEHANIITFHCDLNESSRHIFNRNTLSLIKKQPYIINTARGDIIDEEALINGLRDNLISGCGLDVFEIEPLPKESPLRRMDRAILASHNSNSSSACWDRVHKNSINMLLKGLPA